MKSRIRTMRLDRPLGRALLLIAFAAAMLACGDYGGRAVAVAPAAPPANGLPAPPPTVGDPAAAAAAFDITVRPLLLNNGCEDCHAGVGPGSPHISHADLDTGYQAVVQTQKVNFATPSSSRLVRRLVADFHHCWSDCGTDGMTMEAAIEAWATAIEASNEGQGAVAAALTAGPMRLAQGVEDLGAERYSDHLVAFFDFKDGQGPVARDTSGVEPAMDLSLEGPTWMSSYGIDIEEGKAQAPPETARKLFDRIAHYETGTQQYSVEAWVVPENTDQEGPARIISYSTSGGSRNFTLGQVLYTYDFRNRNFDVALSNNGTPSLQTYPADEDLQATLQHVVITYDQFRGRQIWVDGSWTDDLDEQPPGRLWNWDAEHSFVLGNERTDDRQWVGKIQLLAIYDHALTGAQIQQNFDAGVGKRLILRFDVSAWIGAGGQLEVLVSELDEYSYLFCTPTLLTSNPGGFRVANLRISVNGIIPVTGQAFPNVDVVITQERQELSSTCSIIPKDLGPDSDIFAVEFENLGNYENPVVVTAPPPATVAIAAELVPSEGLRDFARINETMAEVTGVDPLAAGIHEIYLDLQEQLPPAYDLRAFNSANQVGIAKLALEYCDDLIENGPRDVFFPGFPFGDNAVDAFDTELERDRVIVPMVERALGANLTSQPSAAELTTILDGLITNLTAGCTPTTCDAEWTEDVVKGVCAAVLGSAAGTIH